MAYPDFSARIEIVQKKYKIEPGEVAKIIGNNKATAWRWLGSPQKLSESNQERLAEAICTTVNKKHPNLKLDLEKFRIPHTLNFCVAIGLTKLEAAIVTDRGLPVPDVFIDSAFQYIEKSQTDSYRGSYLLFRHDKELTREDKPYLQAYAKIAEDDLGRISYEDSWAGDGVSQAQTYEGFVILGQSVNIVGQRRRSGTFDAVEVFWQGLRQRRDGNGQVTHLYGYVSDVTVETRTIFADRMILVRTTKEEVARVRAEKEYYVTAERVQTVAGKEMLQFIDAWRSVSITDPE